MPDVYFYTVCNNACYAVLVAYIFFWGRRFKWNEMTVRISGTENGCMCDNAWTALFTMTRCKQHHKCRGLITGQLVGGAKKESEKPCPG